MGSGIFGSNVLAGHGFFGFDPTPNSSLVNTARGGGSLTVGSAGIPSINLAPDTNAKVASGSAPSTKAATNTNTNTAPNTNGSGNYNESAAASAQAAADAQDLANSMFQIDSGIGSAQSGLGRLGNQQNIGEGNINDQFQAAVNKLLGQRNLGQQQFDQNMTGQLNEYTAARNKSADGARTWLSGARGVLGTQGAGSGSAARYVLPFEAQNMAAKGNQDAQSTNNKNVVALTQGWDKDKQNLDNEQNNVTHQRDQGMRDLHSQIETKRADLLNTIAQLTGQKNILNGGNAKSALAAANPFLSQVGSILNTIDSLSRTAPIAAQDISLSHPDLSGYNFAKPESAVVATQDPTLSANPVISSLLGDDSQQQQQTPFVIPSFLQDNQQLQNAF